MGYCYCFTAARAMVKCCLLGWKNQLRLYPVLDYSKNQKSLFPQEMTATQNENHDNKQYDSPTRYFLVTPKNVHICSTLQKS